MEDLLLTAPSKEGLAKADWHAAFLEYLSRQGQPRRVLLVPPDATRPHSRAGVLTCEAYRFFSDRGALVEVMPALGTHRPLSVGEGQRFFPGIPGKAFLVHRWREDVRSCGVISRDEIEEETGIDFPRDWPLEVNRRLWEGSYDLILSLGQVVPHEILGMANYTKNLLIGLGGGDGIGRSHMLGALYGMEKLMGRANNPVRRLLDRGAARALADLSVIYALTVVDSSGKDWKGLFCGPGPEVFRRAADLSEAVNTITLPRRQKRVVVALDPAEFTSTWLGNKGIYRSRMALADGGELILAAPGIDRFGEDPGMDKMIRRHGYRGTEAIGRAWREGLFDGGEGAAAHLIHGSSEGRFSITLAAGKLSPAEVEGVGYQWRDPVETAAFFDLAGARPGLNRDCEGQDFFFIDQPALGLWRGPELSP